MMNNNANNADRPQKQCPLCTNNIKYVDYKDVELLSKFVDGYARVQNHRRTGVCAGHQRDVTSAIKRARFLALMPYLAR